MAALADAGATTVFGMPGGGANLEVVGAAAEAGLRFVLAHGETAAAIMAAAHGLLAGAAAPVVVTRGPGVASVANGVAQATLDRYPLVVVADTVPGRSAARVAHQRLDQRGLLGSVAKGSATVTDHTDEATLAALVASARTWPFGAVHLDLDPSAPSPTAPTGLAGPEPAVTVPGDDVARARELVTAARRPVVVVGMEAAASGAGALAPLLTDFGAPVLCTYQAIGVVDTEGPVSAGLFTNGALERPVLDAADLLITVGLDALEPIPNRWERTMPVVRLSAVPDPDRYLPPTVEVVGDLVAVTAEVLSRRPVAPHTWPGDAAAGFRHRARADLVAGAAVEPAAGLGPLELVTTLAPLVPPEATVTVDAGAHFLAIMPLWPVTRPLGLLISNGLATMGFALPAAIGAALARPAHPVVALTGDGGLSMALAELETVARLGLPVTVVVFNDSALSLIEIKQGPGDGGTEAVRYRPVDFGAVAEASGLEGMVVRSADELAAVLGDGGRWHRPRLVDARIEPAPYRRLIAATRG